jgi:hypothetical protein
LLKNVERECRLARNRGDAEGAKWEIDDRGEDGFSRRLCGKDLKDEGTEGHKAF